MRRILSILVAIVLGLGPAIAAVPARAMASDGRSGWTRSGWTGRIDETRIPACCRRTGRHHCSMPDAPSGEIALTSPEDCCPSAPRALASTAPVTAALATESQAGIALSVAQLAHSAAASPIYLRIHRTQPQRGPPAVHLL